MRKPEMLIIINSHFLIINNLFWNLVLHSELYPDDDYMNNFLLIISKAGVKLQISSSQEVQDNIEKHLEKKTLADIKRNHWKEWETRKWTSEILDVMRWTGGNSKK